MNLTSIPVRLGDRSYPIVIADSYNQLPRWLNERDLPKHVWVVSHPHLLATHGGVLLPFLRRSGWHVETLTVPESETSKTFAVAQRLIDTLSRKSMMRVPLLMAFGGGVIGDLTGFVAAVFRRGVPYVQLPTTLLGQVDSAIGGKVGVDLPHGKNLVGAFYQPRLVWNNLALLQTLPMRQRRSGLAEVIKYGAIHGGSLWTFLESHIDSCLAFTPAALRYMVEHSSRIKARIVSRDEREERGDRLSLNFGHTIGHALETATAYRRWTHGEAIAIGMGAAAHLSVQMRVLPSSAATRLVHLIRAAGLPTQAEGLSPQEVLKTLAYDKKFVRGRQRWVLLQRFGQVLVTDHVPLRLVEDALRACLRSPARSARNAQD